MSACARKPSLFGDICVSSITSLTVVKRRGLSPVPDSMNYDIAISKLGHGGGRQTSPTEDRRLFDNAYLRDQRRRP
jgi:hypothetical protein